MNYDKERAISKLQTVVDYITQALSIYPFPVEDAKEIIYSKEQIDRIVTKMLSQERVR